jgi:hypothetical protein
MQMPLPIVFRLAAGPISAETLALDAGDNLLLLTTHSADLGLNLRNVYDRDEGRDEIHVMDNWKFQGRPHRPTTRLLSSAPADPRWKPVDTDLRLRCLYDHLGRYIELAKGQGFALSIDGIDAAARQLDPASV